MLAIPDRKGWYVSVKTKDGRCIEDIITQKVCKTIEEAEKRIAELEKENAELKKKCYKKAVKDYCELEKENVELKNKIRFMGEQIDNLKAIAKYDQLTKAKELLKQLVDIEYAINIPKEKIISLRVKAEQFLSEVENV